MGIGAPKTKRTDPGPTRLVAPRPRRQSVGTAAASSSQCADSADPSADAAEADPALEHRHTFIRPAIPAAPPGDPRSSSPNPRTADREASRPRRTPPATHPSRSGRPTPFPCRALPGSRSTPLPFRVPNAPRITACCDKPLGAVRPLLRPSWFTADPAPRTESGPLRTTPPTTASAAPRRNLPHARNRPPTRQTSGNGPPEKAYPSGSS